MDARKRHKRLGSEPKVGKNSVGGLRQFDTDSIGGAALAMQYCTRKLDIFEKLEAAIWFMLMTASENHATPESMSVMIDIATDRLREQASTFLDARMIIGEIGGNA